MTLVTAIMAKQASKQAWPARVLVLRLAVLVLVLVERLGGQWALVVQY